MGRRRHRGLGCLLESRLVVIAYSHVAAIDDANILALDLLAFVGASSGQGSEAGPICGMMNHVVISEAESRLSGCLVRLSGVHVHPRVGSRLVVGTYRLLCGPVFACSVAAVLAIRLLIGRRKSAARLFLEPARRLRRLLDRIPRASALLVFLHKGYARKEDKLTRTPASWESSG